MKTSCEACGAPAPAERATRKFCSDACRQKAYRARNRPRSHQRRIGLQQAPRPKLDTLAGCTVAQVEPERVRDLIVRYEWMGTIGRANAAYALFAPDGEILGAELFGLTAGTRAGLMCGPENAHLAICLERGACVPWAPRNAPSFLIRRAVKLAAQEHGWRIFYAYADPSAGEVGEIYRTLSWLYLGHGVGRGKGNRWVITDPSGHTLHDRAVHRNGWKIADVRKWPGWKVEPVPQKHKFVWFEGDRRERARLMSALIATNFG